MGDRWEIGMLDKNIDFEKSKELLRQGELRIDGILKFSTEIDNKIFKLLGVSIGIASGLLFYGIKNHTSFQENFLCTFILSFSLLCISIIFLLLAGKPASYKGVGLPLSEFDNENRLEEVLFKSKDRYDQRFKTNKKLNDHKVKFLDHAIYILATSPIFIATFYLQSLLTTIIFVIIAHLFIGGTLYFLFRKFVIQ